MNRPVPKNKSVLQRIGEFFARPKQVVSELIGRASYQFNNLLYRIRPTVDYTQTDYEWYDAFRRGKQKGFEIGGLFANPMTEIIASWALGDGFTIETDNEATEEALGDFLSKYLQTIIETNEDEMALGDAYLLVNADGRIDKISPEQVDIKRNELDFRLIESITIVTNNDAIEIEDKYTATERIVTIKKGSTKTEQRFPNLIGRIPIVPFQNDRSPNEAYGHPIFEPLLTLFADYDDVLRGGVDGVKLMGNPIPVVEGLEDAEGAQRTNATYSTSYTDNEGNSQTDYVTELSANKVYFFGKGAKFHFAAPGNFAENTNTILKKLFYVMLQHAKIPEWVWGGAISSSMASVEAQTPAFVKFIEGQRRKLEQPIKELLQIYLETIALFTPGIATSEELEIIWPELMPQDKALMLQWVMYLQERGLITKESALRLADVVRDVQEEIKKAQAEKKADERLANNRVLTANATAIKQNARNGMANGGTSTTTTTDTTDAPVQ